MKVLVGRFSSESNEHSRSLMSLDKFILKYGEDCIDSMYCRDIFEKNEFDQEMTYTIMKKTIKQLPISLKSNPNKINDFFKLILRRVIPIKHEVPLRPQQRKIIMMVGPTGVGKTTTISKLAARYAYKLGQNYKSSVKGFSSGSYVSSEVIFDTLGRKIKESEPYFEGASASKWNVTDYDDYSRPIKFTAYTGKITTSSYIGRTVTATETNATGRFKTQVFDAIGNLSSVTDKGGTINNTYNAAGDIIEAKYGTNSVTTKYDNWGRKIEFNDPSNGLYKYEYNGYGQLTHSISPKGHKYYNYNEFGQLYNQYEVSNDNTSTKKNIIFEYDNKGRIIKKNGTSNGQFCVFTSENRAWEECLKLREKNPDVELVVKKTKLPLPWKTYE